MCVYKSSSYLKPWRSGTEMDTSDSVNGNLIYFVWVFGFGTK